MVTVCVGVYSREGRVVEEEVSEESGQEGKGHTET